MDPRERAYIEAAFLRMAEIDPEKAREFFFAIMDDDSLDWANMDYHSADLADTTLMALASPELAPVMERLIKENSAKSVKMFVQKVEAVGIATAETFFDERAERWSRSEQDRTDVLIEFYMDAKRAQHLAEQRLADRPELIEDLLDESEYDEIPVDLDFDDFWLDPTADTPDYYASADDQDFALPPEVGAFPNFEKEARQTDLQDLYLAMREGDSEAIAAAAEKIVGKGQIPQAQREFIIDAMRMMANLWDVEKEPEDIPELEDYYERLGILERLVPLPASAGNLEVSHRLLGRSRTIEPFRKALHRKMVETALAAAVHYARQVREGEPPPDLHDMAEKMTLLELQARALYKNVAEEGVPIFREFINYLNEEHKKAGGTYPGEFYVGRDTYHTFTRRRTPSAGAR
jgi:hypothetical protein